jgi:hypothetical protein
LKTWPIPPSPIGAITSYGPNLRAGSSAIHDHFTRETRSGPASSVAQGGPAFRYSTRDRVFVSASLAEPDLFLYRLSMLDLTKFDKYIIDIQ